MMSISAPFSMDSTKIAIKLVKNNALNRTGLVDFNKYGKKDGCQLEPCSEIFIDNFVLEIIVPDYLVMNGKYTEASAATALLWNNLKTANLVKTKPTTIQLAKLSQIPDAEKIEMILFKRPKTTVDNYYSQQFKVACANENFDFVMDFLVKRDYCQRSFYLKDIDVTQDFAGSFSKKELIDVLLKTKQFRMQGSDSIPDDFVFTILDNDSTVGMNCMTYCGQIGDFKIRCKLYNKMVQMLESKCVREQIGNHLFSWANQIGTRLAAARDSSKSKGLTRTEATVYCGENVPSRDFLHDIVQNISKIVDSNLVYSTPFYETWHSYCDNLFHSLVIVDESSDRALVVYSFNEFTGKISGHVFPKWSNNQKWILANLTLNGTLPIDCICIKPSVTDDATSAGGMQLKITGKRFFKYTKGYGTNFKMRLVHTNSLYSIATDKTRLVCIDSPYSDAKCYTNQSETRMEHSGLVSCENCVPLLSTSAANKNSAVDVQFSDSTDICVYFNPDYKTGSFKRKIQVQERILQIKKQKDELSIQLSERSKENKHLKLLKNACKKSNQVPLSSLMGKKWDILALREIKNKLFGTTFSLILVTEANEKLNCNANKSIDEQIHWQLSKSAKSELKIGPSNYLSFCDKRLGTLYVSEMVEWINRNKKIICKVDLFNVNQSTSVQAKPATSSFMEQKNQIVSDQGFDCNLPYKDLPNLGTWKVGLKSEIVAKSWVNHRGISKLAVKLSDGFYYQAGKDLEEKDGQKIISIPQKFLVKQTKINLATRKREAVCVMVT